jgi:hypothetical protein
MGVRAGDVDVDKMVDVDVGVDDSKLRSSGSGDEYRTRAVRGEEEEEGVAVTVMIVDGETVGVGAGAKDRTTTATGSAEDVRGSNVGGIVGVDQEEHAGSGVCAVAVGGDKETTVKDKEGDKDRVGNDDSDGLGQFTVTGSDAVKDDIVALGNGDGVGAGDVVSGGAGPASSSRFEEDTPSTSIAKDGSKQETEDLAGSAAGLGLGARARVDSGVDVGEGQEVGGGGGDDVLDRVAGVMAKKDGGAEVTEILDMKAGEGGDADVEERCVSTLVLFVSLFFSLFLFRRGLLR